MTGRIRAWVMLAVLGLPLPALAHAILLEGMPAAGQSVAAGKIRVVLRFNSRIDAMRSRIALVEGNDTRVLTIAAGATPDVLEAEVEVMPAQVLRWQVLAIDGHITRGEIRFNVETAR